MESKNKRLIVWMLIAGIFGLFLGYSIGFIHGIEYITKTGIEALNLLDIRIDNIEFDFNETQMIDYMVEVLEEKELRDGVIE